MLPKSLADFLGLIVAAAAAELIRRWHLAMNREIRRRKTAKQTRRRKKPPPAG